MVGTFCATCTVTCYPCCNLLMLALMAKAESFFFGLSNLEYKNTKQNVFHKNFVFCIQMVCVFRGGD